jgi:hypothetical protein
MSCLTQLRRALLGTAVSAAIVSVVPTFAQQPSNPVQRAGKYAVELRIPAEGVYAGEETDIEFRVTDTSKEDPVLGAPGVVRAAIAGRVSMPAMASMPHAVPKFHSEGVPGDYGLVTAFPHGGEYRIELAITPPGETAGFQVAFPLAVKDEDTSGKRKHAPSPYTMAVKTDPTRIAVGQPVRLTLTVTERATGRPVTAFDEVHTEKMHLIVVSADLSAFFHEHPTLNPDGTFTGTFTFPSGGEWHLFGDTAPSGAGSQVVMAKVMVDGARAPIAPLLPTMPGNVQVDGLTLAMKATALPARKTIPVTFALTDEQGRPVTDLQPWLGAMGHLILIEKDGQTFVHSHPDESDPSNGKNGALTFLVRFPKPGVYKGWVQFQRAGVVHTMPVVVQTAE